MIWFILTPLQILCMLFCYITNPVVCLFCSEEGELPRALRWWQTWDDSCNPRFYVVERAFSFLRYDYDRHYEEFWDTTPELSRYGRTRCFARLKDPHFTLKERVQRYLCRVLWLTRNCGYGFAFYLFSNHAYRASSVEHEFTRGDDRYIRWGWDASRSIWTRPWWVKIDWYWTRHLHTEGYIGWKMNYPFPTDEQWAMIAHRLVPIKVDLRR